LTAAGSGVYQKGVAHLFFIYQKGVAHLFFITFSSFSFIRTPFLHPPFLHAYRHSNIVQSFLHDAASVFVESIPTSFNAA